jgi:hypothetical protein
MAAVGTTPSRLNAPATFPSLQDSGRSAWAADDERQTLGGIEFAIDPRIDRR